jgi:hypothetical protein
MNNVLKLSRQVNSAMAPVCTFSPESQEKVPQPVQLLSEAEYFPVHGLCDFVHGKTGFAPKDNIYPVNITPQFADTALHKPSLSPTRATND